MSEWIGECEAIYKALWWPLGPWKRYINAVHLPFLDEDQVPVKYLYNPLWCLYVLHYVCIMSGSFSLQIMRLWYVTTSVITSEFKVTLRVFHLFGHILQKWTEWALYHVKRKSDIKSCYSFTVFFLWLGMFKLGIKS